MRVEYLKRACNILYQPSSANLQSTEVVQSRSVRDLFHPLHTACTTGLTKGPQSVLDCILVAYEVIQNSTRRHIRAVQIIQKLTPLFSRDAHATDQVFCFVRCHCSLGNRTSVVNHLDPSSKNFFPCILNNVDLANASRGTLQLIPDSSFCCSACRSYSCLQLFWGQRARLQDIIV